MPLPFTLGNQNVYKAKHLLSWQRTMDAKRVSFKGDEIKAILSHVKARDPDQPEFHQAVEEILETLAPVFEQDPRFYDVFKKMTEPERVIIFRVPWLDDSGIEQINRGFRVQFNSAIGPYKGGLRFHPSVNLSILKFLGFEQTFKNSLTGLPMGGAKGGSDFNPRGKSDNEVMRFCQSFMTELYRHIGPNIDVPAGDIGVGGREVGYLYGQYKRITRGFEGVLTGKGPTWGGSNIRPEATGYGVVYYAQNILQGRGESLKGKRCLVSGSGNVAQFCAEKLLQLGAKVVSASDSGGFVYEPNGFTAEQLDILMRLKNEQRGRISEYIELSGSKEAKYFAGKSPWANIADVDYAFPCATQNEISKEDAESLCAAGCKGVFEGANMPSTSDAIAFYSANKLIYAPAKASNAGGVGVSGLEMSQNSLRLHWSREEVDEKLQGIMKHIYEETTATAAKYGREGDLQLGANAAGFLKVAEAMIQQGCV